MAAVVARRVVMMDQRAGSEVTRPVRHLIAMILTRASPSCSISASMFPGSQRRISKLSLQSNRSPSKFPSQCSSRLPSRPRPRPDEWPGAPRAYRRRGGDGGASVRASAPGDHPRLGPVEYESVTAGACGTGKPRGRGRRRSGRCSARWPCPFVIPAQAGISRRTRRPRFRAEIPACAGMTIGAGMTSRGGNEMGREHS